MRTYKILTLPAQKGISRVNPTKRSASFRRQTRCTISDALAVLESEANFGKSDTATICVTMAPLLRGKYVGLIRIIFDVPGRENGYAVWLPSAEYALARGSGDQWREYLIENFDGAVVDATATTRLISGEIIRAVEIKPARLPLAPTDLDWRIVHTALACCRTAKEAAGSGTKVIETCYRPLKEAARPEDDAEAYMLPNNRLLDCSRLTGFWVPSLDAIAAYWKQLFPNERAPSRQKIANTLADFRIRFPRPGLT
jgi:hypothetical protein